VKPADPEQYVPGSPPTWALEESEMRAKSLLRNAKEKGVHSGSRRRWASPRPPSTPPPLLTNEKTTQAAVSEVADISEVTIRNRYHELLEAEDGLVA